MAGLFTWLIKKGVGLILGYKDKEGSHRGLVRPPAKRVGGEKSPRGFESRTLRHFFCYE